MLFDLLSLRPRLSWEVTFGKSTYYGPLRGCIAYLRGARAERNQRAARYMAEARASTVVLGDQNPATESPDNP